MHNHAIIPVWNSVFLHEVCTPVRTEGPCKAQICPKGVKTPHFGAEFLWGSSKKHYRSLPYENTCVCSWLSTGKGKGKGFQGKGFQRKGFQGKLSAWTLPALQTSPQKQKCSVAGVTCSSCCCSCCSSPGLSGTPSRWRRRKRSVCQHPPTPAGREQGGLQGTARRNHPRAKYRLQIHRGGSADLQSLANLSQITALKEKRAESEIPLPISRV